MLDDNSVRKESVLTLQQCYTLIIAISITNVFQESYKQFTCELNCPNPWMAAILSLTFIATVIPFFHGVNVHFFKEHFAKASGEKSIALMPLSRDITAFIVIAATLYSLSESTDNLFLFMWLWAFLLGFDIVWAFFLGATDRWTKINFWHLLALGTLIGLLALVSKQHPIDSVNQNWLIAIGLLIVSSSRTIFDYSRHIDFYFPRKIDQNDIIYLGGPYTDDNPARQKARYEALTLASAKLVEKGKVVFSPVTMLHPIIERSAIGSDVKMREYWENFHTVMAQRCGKYRILILPGHEKSEGLKSERATFAAYGMSPKYVTVEELGVTLSADVLNALQLPKPS